MAKALATGKILEVEADTLAIAVLADQVVGTEHGSLRCPRPAGAAYCHYDRYSDPRRNRRISGARRHAACACARARRHLSRSYRRTHEGTRAVRRDNRGGVRWAWAGMRDLWRYRRADRAGVDVA